MTRRRHARPGFTLLEMIVVVAVLVLIGAIVLPTISGLTGNTKLKSSADSVKARILEARLAAMEQGRPYVFSVSSDGTKVQVAPDDTVEAPQAADGGTVEPTTLIEELPEDITVERLDTGSGDVAAQTSDGYTRIATFQPDGTCQEQAPGLSILENKSPGLEIHIRGLTGAVTVLPASAATGGMR